MQIRKVRACQGKPDGGDEQEELRTLASRAGVQIAISCSSFFTVLLKIDTCLLPGLHVAAETMLAAQVQSIAQVDPTCIGNHRYHVTGEDDARDASRKITPRCSHARREVPVGLAKAQLIQKPQT